MNEILPLLGLCLRAGKLVCGDDAVADTVEAGDARLLLLSADAGAGIRRRAAFHSEKGTPNIELAATAEEIGWALGRKKTAVCCITDIGFAAAVTQKAAAVKEEYAALAQQLSAKKERIESRRGVKKPHRKVGGGKKSTGRSKSTHTKRGGERA